MLRTVIAGENPDPTQELLEQFLYLPDLLPLLIGYVTIAFDVADDPAMLVPDLQAATMAGVVDFSYDSALVICDLVSLELPCLS